VVILDLRNLRVGPVSDPVRAIVHTATGDDVDTVLVDGRVVVENGTVPGYTERELVGRAQGIAERLWAHRWPERAGAPS
jgi:cytosine/adenosine deaminase-related metal-dependent hydrolase